MGGLFQTLNLKPKGEIEMIRDLTDTRNELARIFEQLSVLESVEPHGIQEKDIHNLQMEYDMEEREANITYIAWVVFYRSDRTRDGRPDIKDIQEFLSE